MCSQKSKSDVKVRRVGKKYDTSQLQCEGTEANEEIINILDEITIPVPWEVGDILMVDNMTALHGRLPFTGDRKILASMSTY